MFDTIKRIFRRAELPVKSIQDSALGLLTWSSEWEAWCGHHGTRDFFLTYDGSAEPSVAVRTYALRVLTNDSWLEQALIEARNEALSKYSSFYNPEILSLSLGALHFSVHPQRGESFDACSSLAMGILCYGL